MPKHRNKNRNRNKNKQRTRQQQQEQQQQQEPQKQAKEKEENCNKESASSSATANTSGHALETPPHPIAGQLVPNSTEICLEKHVANVDKIANEKPHGSNAVHANQQALEKVPDITVVTIGKEAETNSVAAPTETNDTVLYEPSRCDNNIGNKHVDKAGANMGNEKSKIINNEKHSISSQSIDVLHITNQIPTNVTAITPSNSPLGKVIVHRIVCEDSSSGKIKQAQPALINQVIPITAALSTTSDGKEATTCASSVQEHILKNGNEQEQKVIATATNTTDNVNKILESDIKVPEHGSKIIVHKVFTEEDGYENQPESSQLPKELVGKEREEKNEENNESLNYIIRKDISDNECELKELPHKVMVHKIVASADNYKKEENEREDKIQEEVYAEENINKLSDNGDNIYKDSPVAKVEPDIMQQQSKVIVHQILLEDNDEMPKITSPTMKDPVLSIAKPTTSEVSIVEISDENLSDLEELRSPVVSEAESSIEYSDENQKISESITEVSSSSSCSTTPTTSKQSRKQKRIALEHHFLPQMLNPRFLDSITEENSELSDNSENPLSRSVSTESSTNCPTEGKAQKLNAKFPKSSLDFSKPHKQQSTRNRKSKIIREETVALAVAARLHDVPNADESCSTVRSCMSPEAQAAEVVFINSASSSVSDLHDLELFENVHTTTPEITLGGDSKNIISKKTENNIGYESLTSSPPQCTSAFTAKITEQQLPEFCANQSNSYNNNQTINNNKLVNNSTAQTPPIPATTDTVSKTRSLAEIDTNLNANSPTDSILVSSLPSSPANDQLVFAQIEEQISSVLSSINEIASQHTTTATTTPKITSSSSSSSSSPQPQPPSPSLSTSTYLNTHTNLSNTQKLPVTTTTSTTATTRTLENSCEESFKAVSGSSLCAANNAKTSRPFSRDGNMNTVRDIIINNNGNDNTVKANGNNANSVANGYVKLNYNYSNTFYPIISPRGSPPPPPIPPPSREHEQEQCLDECDNKLDSALPPSISATSFALPLLQKNVDYHDSQTQSLHATSQDLKTALSQLTSSITRQKSMDSHCSDSTSLSQCTAINVATDQSDKSDSVQASLISDLKPNFIQQSQPSDKSCISTADPKKLRLLCAETLSTFPYGDTVLEELATIAQNIGEAGALKDANSGESMPYPLPELPHIDDLQLSLKVGKTAPDRPQLPTQDPDQSWLGVPTTHDPKVLVCLSPSQRSYIQQKPQQKPDDLLDAHQKFVERRGYHEYTKEQLEHLQREKLAEQQLLETAALMKKLRKSITPPPPQIPPPPVPVKSSETASKAKNLSKRTLTTAPINDTPQPSNDVKLSNDNEQMPAATNGPNDGEENKHRLLSIMQDTNESNANTQKLSAAALSSTSSSSSSSAYENNSRQTTNDVSVPAPEQEPPSATSIFSKDFLKNSYQFIHSPEDKTSSTMQSVEKTLGQMFPAIGSTNIFDQKNKRFSNIESSNAEPFCSQIMNTQPKRYSSIETHSYEAQKRIENGTVVQDFSTTKHESKTSGSKADQVSSFPVKTSLFKEESNSFMPAGKDEDKSAHYTNKQEIMSALNLTKHTSDLEKKQQQSAKQSEKIIKFATTETSHNIVNDEYKSAKTVEKDLTKMKDRESGIENTYEEFRHRAKAAADAAATLPSFQSAATTATTDKVTLNANNNVDGTSEATTHHRHNYDRKATTLSRDHERLFKEFDDLSKQLHQELENSKAEREQREKSASMFDLNRIHMRQKEQIEEFNKTRCEHLRELEQGIERSMRSRSLKFARPQGTNVDVVDHQSGRTYEIPIHMENGNTTTPAASASEKCTSPHDEPPPLPKHPKTYQIPIQMENSNSLCIDDAHFRRAESMFNLSDDLNSRQRTYSNQTQYQKHEDDWSKYASDLGSSENIVRPFAKEVAICYQRRPGGIRAPRLTASTNDLSFNKQHCYDQYNAYNVPRQHHAPMLNGAPEQSRPKFGSCYSMIERDPNPKYISTTTRRGISPAPQPTGFFPLDSCHVKEEDMRQRRASLPRELHEQQLKYITNKEEELRTEFERLQSERRRLMEEAEKVHAVRMDPTPTSPVAPIRSLQYRSAQKLPTVTEDEVFRQQMAEEWLNKVAERENRRLQNIIKISKIQEDEAIARHKADMGEEFLSRVKERRHKLAMPADSDWESGAESHPNNQAQHSEAEDIPPMKVIEGEQEANLRGLPRHLREFAKFSNRQRENIEGGHREHHHEEERSEETTDNSISRAFKKSSVVKTVKTLRAPMLQENHGHDYDNDDYKNDTDNDNDSYYDDTINSHHNGARNIAVSTLNRNTLESFSNLSSNSPSSSHFSTQFPGSIDEMFGKSPFRSRIFEEFNNYWRNFHNTGNKF